MDKTNFLTVSGLITFSLLFSLSVAIPVFAIEDCNVGSSTSAQASLGLLGSTFGEQETANCQKQHEDYLKSINAIQDCTPGSGSSSSAYYGMAGTPAGTALEDNCRQQHQDYLNSLQSTPIIIRYYGSSQEDVDKEYIVKMNTYCTVIYGIHSYYDDSIIKCKCESGYIMNPSNLCVETQVELDRLNTEEQQKIEEIFQKYYQPAMDYLPPEFREVVDPSIVKKMFLDKTNAKKTMVQVIMEKYGDQVNTLIQSRKPIINTNIPIINPTNSGNDLRQKLLELKGQTVKKINIKDLPVNSYKVIKKDDKDEPTVVIAPPPSNQVIKKSDSTQNNGFKEQAKKQTAFQKFINFISKIKFW
jgi:hypothetical protein